MSIHWLTKSSISSRQERKIDQTAVPESPHEWGVLVRCCWKEWWSAWLNKNKSSFFSPGLEPLVFKGIFWIFRKLVAYTAFPTPVGPQIPLLQNTVAWQRLLCFVVPGWLNAGQGAPMRGWWLRLQCRLVMLRPRKYYSLSAVPSSPWI